MSVDTTAISVGGYSSTLRRLTTLIARYGVVLVAVGLFVALSVASPAFLTPANLSNLVQQWAFVGIIACAATLLMIAGAFDLSVGATFALSGVVAATTALAAGTPLGLLAGLATGLVIGCLNGLVVGYLGVNSFLATLATGFILRGVATTITGGLLISVSVPGFTFLGRERFLGFPIINWIFILVFAACAILLSRTVFGRQIFAVGANRSAAFIAGVNVSRTTFTAYLITGVAAALAGVLATSQSGTGQAATGTGYELLVVAAVVLGGTSITGGSGAVWRTVVGTLVLGMIANGSNLLGLTGTVQQIIQGAIILLAVLVDRFSRKGA